MPYTFYGSWRCLRLVSFVVDVAHDAKILRARRSVGIAANGGLEPKSEEVTDCRCAARHTLSKPPVVKGGEFLATQHDL